MIWGIRTVGEQFFLLCRVFPPRLRLYGRFFFLEKFATSSVQSLLTLYWVLINEPTFSQLHWGPLWCDCTSGKQWSYIFPVVSLRWIKQQFVLKYGCSWLQHGNFGIFVARSVICKVQRSKDKWSSCLQMQCTFFFTSTVYVLTAQSASSGCKNCVVKKAIQVSMMKHLKWNEMKYSMSFDPHATKPA